MKKYLLVPFIVSMLMGFSGFVGQNSVHAASPKYPTKAINLIVPWSPGGGADLSARAIASVAPKYLGQSLIVIQKPGAAGATAHAEMVKMKKDGYNLIITGNSPSTVVPHLGKTNYDALNDFEFIIRITNLRNCFAVAADSPFNTIGDLIAYAKTNPQKVKVGLSGALGIGDLTIRLFNKIAGIELVQVPFQSAGESVVAVMGGHTNAYSGSITSVSPAVKNKNIKILAITAGERDPSFPDIPTLKDLGIDVALNNQIGIGAPKGTPKVILDFLHGAFKQSLDDPGFKALAQKLEFSIDYLNGVDFRKSIIADSDQVKAILAK
jgi:tripartite-type tricarboxylate transporter receptor subunit TctC